MTSPLVSVVMSIRNCEKFIKESIESIFNQTFNDFEIIIYNDVSIDKTWEIVQNIFKEFDISYILINRVIGNNVFCGEGRNRAIKEAKGKYIAIQDGDDISFPERLEKEVSFMEKNDDIFCVGSWAEVIDENGKYLETYDYPPSDSEDIRNEILIKYHNPIIDPSSMFRKDIFNVLGGYDNKWKLVPDFHLWIKAVMKGYRLVNLAELLVYYRKHSDSVTNKTEMAVVKEHFKMCKEIIKREKLNG